MTFAAELGSAATKALLDAARPASEVVTSSGQSASAGARWGTFQVSALAMASLASDFGVQPASGAIPSAAKDLAIVAMARSRYAAGMVSILSTPMSAAETRMMPRMAGL